MMKTRTSLWTALSIIVLCLLALFSRGDEPSELTLLRNTAVIELDAGRYAEALDKFKSLVLLQTDPFQLIYTYKYLSQCHEQLGDHSSAVACQLECWGRFRGNMQLMPDGLTPVDHAASTVVSSSLAELYRSKGRYLEALEYYHTQNGLLGRTISLYSANEDALTTPMLRSLEDFTVIREFGNAFRIGDCLYHLGRYKEALTNYQHVRDQLAKHGHSLAPLSTREDAALNDAYKVVLSARIAECHEKMAETTLAADEWRNVLEELAKADSKALSHPFFEGFGRKYTSEVVRSRLEKIR